MNVMGHPELQLTINDRLKLTSEIFPKIKLFAEQNNIQITRINKADKCTEFSYTESHIDCLAGHTFLAITPDLNILPCDICRKPLGKWEQTGDIAKIHKMSMKIWELLEQPWCMT